MTTAELKARAHQRAHDQRVHIFAVPGRTGYYTTKSKSDPAKRYSLVIVGGEVACSCPGWNARRSCKHSEALENRLARERMAENETDAEREAREIAEERDVFAMLG